MSRRFKDVNAILKFWSAQRKARTEWLGRNWNGIPQAFVPRVIPQEEKTGRTNEGGLMTFPEIPNDSPEFAV